MHTDLGAAGICHRTLQERPAAIGEVRAVSEGETSLVACYMPDLELEVITPPREVGYSDEEIRTLGEVNM